MAKKSKTNPKTGTDVGGVDLAEVERLLEFMEKHGLQEFEYAPEETVRSARSWLARGGRLGTPARQSRNGF
jgi:hypothetical protein